MNPSIIAFSFVEHTSFKIFFFPAAGCFSVILKLGGNWCGINGLVNGAWFVIGLKNICSPKVLRLSFLSH